MNKENKCKEYKRVGKTIFCLNNTFISHSSFCENERKFNKRHKNKKNFWDDELEKWVEKELV